MSKNTGGPAFPFSPSDESTVQHHHGMTLRDYFAAEYLEGYMANPEIGLPTREDVAREAYAMADAMLKERAK